MNQASSLWIHRKSPRLQGYDDSLPGVYFVTICTDNEDFLFGDIHNGRFRANALGRIVGDAWLDLPNHFPGVTLYDFVIMPNHVHGLVMLSPAGAGPRPALQSTTLSTIVGSFKTHAARRINVLRGAPGSSVWKRSFYDHVIRSDRDLEKAREYILANSAMWEMGRDFQGASTLLPLSPNGVKDGIASTNARICGLRQKRLAPIPKGTKPLAAEPLLVFLFRMCHNRKNY